MFLDKQKWHSYYYNDFDGPHSDNSDPGEALDEFDRALKAAELKIDELSFGRITAIGFDNLTEFQQKCVKDAVCYQTAYYLKHGYDGIVESYSVPDISVSVSKANVEATRNCVSPFAVPLLTKCNLNSRRL